MKYVFIFLLSMNFAFAMGDPSFLPANPSDSLDSLHKVSAGIKKYSQEVELQAQEEKVQQQEKETKQSEKKPTRGNYE